jgi:hypothetical protein
MLPNALLQHVCDACQQLQKQEFITRLISLCCALQSAVVIKLCRAHGAARHLPLQRVSDVYQQLQSEIQDPRLHAASASELVLHMLQLQAEGLPVAQGQDPLALLLAARESRFAAAMQAVAADHDRAVGRLRSAMAAAAADEKLQVGWFAFVAVPIAVMLTGHLVVIVFKPKTCRLHSCRVQ